MDKKENMLDGLIEQELEKTSSFTDIMSRRERKRLEKLKQQAKREDQELEMQKQKITKIKEIINENEEYKKEFHKKKKQKQKEKQIQEQKLEEIEEKAFQEKKTPTPEMQKEEPKIPSKNSKWSIFLGIILLLLCFGIGGFLAYQCFYLKEYGKKELLVNGILLIPLFFSSLVCFTKEKTRKIATVFCDITLILAILITLGVKFEYIKLPKPETLPDFTGVSLTEVIDYTKKHNISLEQIYEYSDYTPEYHVILQNVKAETPLKEVTQLTVTVSSGPNYDKEIILPSMVGWNIDEALLTIKENFLNHITVHYVLNEETSKDTIISQSITGQIKRNAELILEVSLGKGEDLVPVRIPDFKNMSLFEATLWLKRNGIPYDLQYEFSENIKREFVLSQNMQKGTMIDPKTEKITLIISKGKQIKVPNLLSMTIEEVLTWITDNHLKIQFKDRYDTSVEAGKMIEVSHQKGDIIEEGTVIQVVTSKGQLRMKEFKDINEFRSWATRYGILFKEEYEFNSQVESGGIISFSIRTGDVINIHDTILVKISNGASLTVPNFIGSTKSNIQTQCKNLGLNCTFYYQNSTKAKDTAISQNKRSGSIVAKGTSVRIGLSNGVNPKPSPSPSPKPDQCTANNTYNLIIQPSWVTGGSANTTISTLRSKFASKYPNIKFNFQTKKGNNPSGYIHEDSPITNGSTIKDCNTYTILITE